MNRKLMLVVICLFLISLAYGDVWDSGTYFRPSLSNTTYVYGEDITMTTILVNETCMIITGGFSAGTYCNISSSPTNITFLNDPNFTLSGFKRDITAELGSIINITSVSTDSVCIDVDHPQGGVNVTCGIGTLQYNANITYFVETENEDLDFNLTPSNFSFTIGANQYDTIQRFILNLTGHNSPTDVKVYVNDQLSNDIGLIPENTFTDLTELNTTDTELNLSFTANELKLLYIKIPKTANVTDSTLNLTYYNLILNESLSPSLFNV